MSDRKINYIVIFLTVALFVLQATIIERYVLLLAVLLATGVAFLAFFLNFLTIDGARSSIVIGTITFGFGGMEATTLLILFFLTSNLVGLPFGSSTVLTDNLYKQKMSRRSGIQVWANAFWFIMCIFLWFVAKADMFLIGAFASIATATSDTWATEIGTRYKNSRTWLITSSKRVDAGTDGGISIPGTLATIAGAALIAAVSLYFPKNFIVISAVSIGLAGFLGSLTDSLLGAIFQTGKRRLPVMLVSGDYHANNIVNFLATGFGMLYGFILFNILVYVLV